jgi:hypothetical protein
MSARWLPSCHTQRDRQTHTQRERERERVQILMYAARSYGERSCIHAHAHSTLNIYISIYMCVRARVYVSLCVNKHQRLMTAFLLHTYIGR